MLKATCGVSFTLATARYLVSAAAQLLAALRATASWKRARAWASSSLVCAWALRPAQKLTAIRPRPRAARRRAEPLAGREGEAGSGFRGLAMVIGVVLREG